MSRPRSIWIGYDPREAAAFAVARYSIKKFDRYTPIRGVVLSDLQKRGLYTRPTEFRASAADRPIMWDVISEAPCATEFSISRFLVPLLAQSGWALFMDCDFLVRCDLSRLFERLDPKYAVYCVKHDYRPKAVVKMDNQPQSTYGRKLWSSFCVFNCEHSANRRLTVDLVNTAPGRDLHAFCWLKDEDIGALDEEWNWIPGHSPENVDPRCVHYSEGGPWFAGYEDVKFAEEWREELRCWAA